MTGQLPPVTTRSPAWIVIYPDPSHNRWRHAQSGPATGILDGHLDLPASATPAQARQAAETLLAELSRTYYHRDLTIHWHPPDANGWITGGIQTCQNA